MKGRTVRAFLTGLCVSLLAGSVAVGAGIALARFL
jgi:hypothetical protein